MSASVAALAIVCALLVVGAASKLALFCVPGMNAWWRGLLAPALAPSLSSPQVVFALGFVAAGFATALVLVCVAQDHGAVWQLAVAGVALIGALLAGEALMGWLCKRAEPTL